MDKKHIAKVVKERRLYLGLTQEQLAIRAGVTRPVITGIETAKKETTMDCLASVLGALGVELGLVLSNGGV